MMPYVASRNEANPTNATQFVSATHCVIFKSLKLKKSHLGTLPTWQLPHRGLIIYHTSITTATVTVFTMFYNQYAESSGNTSKLS